MTRAVKLAFASILLISLAAPGWAQRRDPLTESEVDQLRETAQDPEKRMKLYVGFAKARMEIIQRMRVDPKLAGENGSELGKTLEDLAVLVDEVDDNLDQFNTHSQDLRKPLKQIVDMDSDFQVKLRELKEASTPAQLREYGFSLDSAIDSVNESADAARAMLQDQIAKRGKPKENPKEDKEDAKPAKRDDPVKAPCSPC